MIKNKKMLYIILGLLIFVMVSFGIFDILNEKSFSSKEPYKVQDLTEFLDNNNEFRNVTLGFLEKATESYFTGREIKHPEKQKIEKDWQVKLTLYHKGKIKGEGQAISKVLSQALERALKIALTDERVKNLNKENSEEIKFFVEIPYSPSDSFSFVGSRNKIAEIIEDNLVVQREVNKDLIEKKIEQGKEFLLSLENKKHHGFHKYYVLEEPHLEERLHTVYSASIVYTFLYLQDYKEDQFISDKLSDWGEFLLRMQNKNKEDKHYGAFHYSYFLNKETESDIQEIESPYLDKGKWLTGKFYLDKQGRELKFVVGTSALNIFTLLRLYEFTGQQKYLKAAKLAGDWLLTMQNDNGTMKPYTRYRNGSWYYGKKESLLYEGQVLSSLSKLYEATKEGKYYSAVKKIADRFVDKFEKAGHDYVRGEYRNKNPISNSWVVMSLMDFYKVTGEEYYKSIVFELSEKILKNQIEDTNNLIDLGRFKGAHSTSGNGWISEVMTETYMFCKEQGRADCENYKQGITKVMRWLIQYTFSEQNSFFVENPEKIIGAPFWSPNNKHTRSDSACHTLNGYVKIINELKEDQLIFVPEKPISEFLNLK